MAGGQVGICLVGLASVLSGEGSQTHAVSTGDMLLGMGLIVASQARLHAISTFLSQQAQQCCMEEAGNACPHHHSHAV